jgi:toxin FitB
MIYLVDANILSEPTKQAPSSRVVEWLARNESELVVDPIVMGELRIGVLALPAGRERTRLEDWVEALERTIECLSWDLAVSRRWARLVSDLRRRGHRMPLLDGMIAASALEYGLVVATHNRRDFEVAGVQVLDPFQ